jgi:plastocyanin
MKNQFLFATLLLSIIFISSCKKEDTLTGNGPVTIHFDNRAGADDFAFSTNYTTAAGDTVNFTKVKYYVSNFVLVKSDGSQYVIPQSETYRLIDEAVDSTQEITFNNIPAGDYTSVKYIIGVDSLRSTTDVSQRTGDLDPAGGGADMYWSWNSGYIFFKIEGTSPQSTEMGNMFMYHIGGFGGYSSAMALTILETLRFHSSEAIEVAFWK